MSSIVTPNVFATSKEEFDERFEKVVPLAEWVQIDFMDGKFVSAISLAVLEIPDLHEEKAKFEAHLMVEEPWEYIELLKKKGFSKVIFHYEACEDDEKVKDTIMKIKLSGMIPGIAINPKTPVRHVYPFLDNVRYVMFMGIQPGQEQQEFIHEVYDKITELKNHDHEVVIQVDGGVNDKTAALLARAGCSILNSGSYVGNADNPKKAIKKLEEEFKKGLE